MTLEEEIKALRSEIAALRAELASRLVQPTYIYQPSTSAPSYPTFPKVCTTRPIHYQPDDWTTV